MPHSIDRRDAFTYAEARRLAERERAIATRLLWRAARHWISARFHRSRTAPLKPAIRLG
jgi:hypothetical protein